MKRLFYFIAALCCCSTVSAQSVNVFKDGKLYAEVFEPDSVNFVAEHPYTREEAELWAIAHLDSLAKVVWDKMQSADGINTNKRDPDATREVFRSIGYNGKNVYTYTAAGEVVDKAILDSLIAKAVANNNKTAVLLCGSSGSGKSYAVSQNKTVQEKVAKAGLVLDEVFYDVDRIKAIIAQLNTAGISDVSIVMIHNDALTAYTNAVDRYVTSGRVIGLKFFLYLFTQYVGFVEKLEAENIGTERFYIENAGNSSGGVISVDAAKAWDYTISDELKGELCARAYDKLIEHKEKINPRDVWAIIFDE